jgi:RNA polymerase sigma-70 factor (ECF subfamily)
LGVSEAVSKLFLRHQYMLMDYVHGLVRNAADAEDLFQETSIRILALFELPGPEKDFPAWCRGVARNLILHYWRDRRRERDMQVLEAADLAYREADADAGEWEFRRLALADCVKALPPASREMLDQHYLKGWTSGEIGRRQKRTATSVRMWLSRVRRQLLDCIEGRLAGEVGHGN